MSDNGSYPNRPADGRTRRISRVFRDPSGKALVVALDDSLISGPGPSLNAAAGLPKTCAENGADALMAHIGTFLRQVVPPSLGRIVNLSASTTRSTPTRKVLATSLSQALKIDADAVAFQIHLGSQFEGEMLRQAGSIVSDASRYEIPVLLVAYPRTENSAGSADDFESLKVSDFPAYVGRCVHAARVAVELGADIVKARYPGTPETFREIVEACDPVPVLIAGGTYRPKEAVIADARSAIRVGGAGVSFGRAISQAKDPSTVLRELHEAVHTLGQDQVPGKSRQ